MTWLAITARCEREDLTDPSLAPAAELLVAKFHELRSLSPDTGERISGLQERDCLSLHGSRYRAVTWYDRQSDVVWLLAAQIHRDDSQEDSYDMAIALEGAGRLYPTEDDYAALAANIARNAESERVRQEAAALKELRERILRTADTAIQRFNSPHGLYAEMWAEIVPGLAALTLRIRILRLDAQRVTDSELTVVLEMVFADTITPDEPYQEIGDADGRFRCFEGYFAV